MKSSRNLFDPLHSLFLDDVRTSPGRKNDFYDDNDCF